MKNHPHPFFFKNQSMQFIAFSATSSGLTVVIDNATQPTQVNFKLSDETTVIVTTPDDITGTEHTYTYAGDFSDGIYTATANPGESDELSIFITNTLVGMNCLLQKTLKKDYDCRLVQELEAVKQWTFSQDEALAREVYQEILERCAECSSSYHEGLAGISIWIVNNDFIVQ